MLHLRYRNVLRHLAIRCPSNSQYNVVQTGHSQGWVSLESLGLPVELWDRQVGHWDNSQGWKSFGCPGDSPVGQWDSGTDRTLG